MPCACALGIVDGEAVASRHPFCVLRDDNFLFQSEQVAVCSGTDEGKDKHIFVDQINYQPI